MRKRLFDSVVSFFCLLLYAYFSWHYYYGSRNLTVLDGAQAKAAELHAELQKEIDIRQRLEAKVALLRPEHLDPDLLDEMARRILDYGSANELIVSTKYRANTKR
ncbi:MAG: FtsB family cell division protein [Aestuariivirgaceae bacterium]